MTLQWPPKHIWNPCGHYRRPARGIVHEASGNNTKQQQQQQQQQRFRSHGTTAYEESTYLECVRCIYVCVYVCARACVLVCFTLQRIPATSLYFAAHFFYASEPTGVT